jgi:hypothetical protein
MAAPDTSIYNNPSPAEYAELVTPAASDLPAITRGIYIAAAGNLTVVMAGKGNTATVTFNNVVAGSVLPLRVRQITAAPANTVALY